MEHVYKNLSQVFLAVLFSLGIAAFLGYNQVQGQCADDNTFALDMTPPAPGWQTTSNCIRAGQYVTVSVCAGAQYTFQTCNSGSYDTQLTLYNNAGGGPLAYNDDDCGVRSRIIWTATFTGVVRVLLDEYPCVSNNVCQRLRVIWNTGCPGSGNPGDDCANAIPMICGGSRTNETTIGNGDTGNNWSCYSPSISTPGDDRFYSITITDPAATVLRVTLTNVVDSNDTYLEAILLGTTCSSTTCENIRQFNIANGTFSANGLTNFDFAIPGAGIYYFVIDAQSDGITSYDIAFDCISTGVKPDTSGCAGPPEDTDQNAYELRWNGGLPGEVIHGDTGTLCYTLYVTNPNPSGWEWLKYVDFNLGPCWTNVTNISPDAPPGGNGWYNLPGDWNGAYNVPNNAVQYDFVNSINPIWGDGNSPGFTCQQFEFCFWAEVDTSGCPGMENDSLNIIIYMEDDGFGGSGFSQPSNALILSSDFFFPSSLPVELDRYEAYSDDEGINLEWRTLTEVNADEFIISRSEDGSNFSRVATVEASGTSREPVNYGWKDQHPVDGLNFYQLSQVDRDGSTNILGIRKAVYSMGKSLVLQAPSPNPFSENLSLSWQAPVSGTAKVTVLDLMGKTLQVSTIQVQAGQGNANWDLSTLARGTYFLKFELNGESQTMKIFKAR